MATIPAPAYPTFPHAVLAEPIPPPPRDPPPRPPPAFSHEVLTRIVSHLDPLDGRHLRALSRLCRVNKAWCRAAQPAFWSVVALYDRRVYERPPPPTTWGQPPPPPKRRKDRDVVREALEKRATEMKAAGFADEVIKAEARRLMDELLDKEDYDADDLDLEWSAVDLIDVGTHRFLATLEESPHLVRHVRRLAFYGKYEGRAAARALQTVLAACTSVDSVELVYPRSAAPRRYRGGEARESINEELFRWRDVPSFDAGAVIGRIAGLRSLTLTTFLLSHLEGLLRTLAPLQHLEHLELSVLHDRQHCRALNFSNFHTIPFAFSPPPIPAYRLRTLNLGGVLDQSVFSILVNPHVASLTSLTVTLRNRRLVLPSFPRLSHLCVVFAKPRPVADTLASAPPSLRHLELRFSEYVLAYHDRAHDAETGSGSPEVSERDPNWFEYRESNIGIDWLLDHLPPQLARLSFPYNFSLEPAPREEDFWDDKSWQHADTLLAAIKARDKRGKKGVPTWLPALKVLDVADYARQSEPELRFMRLQTKLGFGDWDAKKRLAKGQTAEPVPREIGKARTRRKKLQAACDARGLWLSGRWKEWEQYCEFSSWDLLPSERTA
ncbi:hypothetical protein JCM10213_008646 [Rhodosporidiobolus nylandii]